MGFIIAVKTFVKALREPKKAQSFLEEDKQPKVTKKEKVEPSHLRLLKTLQQSGRLIDFLKEDISAYTDAQVGAVVRKLHASCGEAVEDMITVRAIYEESEGCEVKIPQGYDPSEVKVVGNVTGEGPYTGRLVHKGWKAHKISLPKQVGEINEAVLCAAEVEVK